MLRWNALFPGIILKSYHAFGGDANRQRSMLGFRLPKRYLAIAREIGDRSAEGAPLS
jgi:hypothetical protein